MMAGRVFIYDGPVRPKRKPPPQRKRVLDFICAEIAAARPFPTTAAIREHMGWQHDASVLTCLALLRGDGHLKMVGWHGRRVVYALT